MAHDIPVRKSPFGFDHVIDPVWHPEQHEWSHMLNGASLTMPYLEPFLNRTLREAADHIDDEDLLADIKGFIGQEAQHFQTHRRYNEGLKAAGHAELAEVERGYEADYVRLAKRSLALRLAYCAGFETMTMGMTEWLVHDRIRLFRGGDPTVASFSLWHMVEETEHKSVAFDVFQAVSGSYLLRVAGLLHGSFHVAFMARRAYIAMLKKDGLWYRPQSRLRVWGRVTLFLVRASGAMLRSLRPSYHPDQVADPAWIGEWREAWEARDDDREPLLDTQSCTIPAVFHSPAAA